MTLTASDEKVQIVPGVESPRWVEWDGGSTISLRGGGVDVALRLECEEGRYVCTDFRLYRSPTTDRGTGFVTSELLRDTTLAHWIGLALTVPRSVLRELPNPDNVEPWGLTPPKGLSEEGPTDRALQWVAHLYRCSMAVSMNPAQQVEMVLELTHSTAARWIRMAREKGYLGPSEGPGRAAG